MGLLETVRMRALGWRRMGRGNGISVLIKEDDCINGGVGRKNKIPQPQDR